MRDCRAAKPLALLRLRLLSSLARGTRSVKAKSLPLEFAHFICRRQRVKVYLNGALLSPAVRAALTCRSVALTGRLPLEFAHFIRHRRRGRILPLATPSRSSNLDSAKKDHPIGWSVFWLITVILIQDQENVFFNTSSKILFFNLYEKTAE